MAGATDTAAQAFNRRARFAHMVFLVVRHPDTLLDFIASPGQAQKSGFG